MKQILFYGSGFIVCIVSFVLGLYILFKLYEMHITRLAFMGKEKWHIQLKLFSCYTIACLMIMSAVVYYMNWL